MNDNINALPPISFAEATKKGFLNLFNFKGRARRSEYWWFVLTVGLICTTICLVLGCTYGQMSVYDVADHIIVYTLLLFIAIILPAALLVSIQTRRMHDVGKNAVLPLCSFVCTIATAFIYSYYTYIAINLTDALFTLHISNSEMGSTDSLESNPVPPVVLILTCLIAFLQLIMLIYTLKDSLQSENRYGESTKYVK